MYRAEVRDGYVYVIDTNTAEERSFYVPEAGNVVSAEVTGDDEVMITSGGYETKYRISTGNRA